ncbi:MAG: acetyl-CoA carboxylase biotin carboxyl carrier protein [Deltaproteobacteria bacterium]|nr:acetyl-CoA carboxylase biotin carboxyl carrier protein [Deltaproteobacteria bacterium]
MEIDLEQLKSLMRALRRYDLTKIEVRHGEQTIVLERAATGHSTGPMMAGAFPMATGGREFGDAPPGYVDNVSRPSMPPPAPVIDQNLTVVTSPLVGTFYRAAAPTARSFVEVGSTVKKGQVLCIVEAMKLMNEIEAELDGTIAEILIENGKPVEFGEKLFKIRVGG